MGPRCPWILRCRPRTRRRPRAPPGGLATLAIGASRGGAERMRACPCWASVHEGAPFSSTLLELSPPFLSERIVAGGERQLRCLVGRQKSRAVCVYVYAKENLISNRSNSLWCMQKRTWFLTDPTPCDALAHAIYLRKNWFRTTVWEGHLPPSPTHMNQTYKRYFLNRVYLYHLVLVFVPINIKIDEVSWGTILHNCAMSTLKS